MKGPQERNVRVPGEENLDSRLRRPEGEAGWREEKVMSPGGHQRGITDHCGFGQVWDSHKTSHHRLLN